MKPIVTSFILALGFFGTPVIGLANQNSAVGFGPNAPARHPVVGLKLLSPVKDFTFTGACGFLIPPVGKEKGGFYIYSDTNCTSNTANAVHGERLLRGGMTFAEFKKMDVKERQIIAAKVFDNSAKVILRDAEPGLVVADALQVDTISGGVKGLAPNRPKILYAAYHLPNFGADMKVAVGEISGNPKSGFELLSLCQFSSKNTQSEYTQSCEVTASNGGSLEIRMRMHTQVELKTIDSDLARK